MNLRAPVLLLLCHLALAATARNVLSQEKPTTSDPGLVKDAKAVVAIVSDEEIYFNKEKVIREALPEKVRQALEGAGPEEQTVYIKAGCPVKYGIVVFVVNELRDAGFDRIGLVANKEGGTGQPRATGVKNPASHGGTVQTGVAAEQVGSSPSQVVLIDVESPSLVRLNSRHIPLSRLQTALEETLANRGDKTVFVRAPREIAYCEVVKVINTAKAAGAQPIGLQVDGLK